MHLLSFISDLGKSKTYDKATNTAIAFTNWISVIVILASLGCTFLSYNLSDRLVTISWIFTAVNASSLILTASGFFLIARYVLNIGPSLYLAILHVAIKQPDQEIITAVLLIQIGVLTVPWIMFKAKEKAKLHLVNGLNLSFIFASVYLQGQNTELFDNSIYVSGPGVDFGLMVCTFGGLVIMSFVNWTNHKGQEDIQELLTEMENKNQQMQQDQLQLKEYITKVEEAQKIEQERQWITQSVAAITEIMRTQRNTGELYDVLLSTIVKTLKASQGAFYLTAQEVQEAPQLVMKACYAFNRKKYLEHTLAAGEGLLGQCYLEKEIIYLNDVPEGYTRIQSGLGQSTPTAIIIIPLQSDEQVEGILEIASFQEIAQHQVAYLEQLATILGSFIYHDKMMKKPHNLADREENYRS